MAYGGARPGAGRKPKRKIAVKKVLAEAILASINELEMWQDLLTATAITSVAVIGGESGVDRETMTVPDYDIRLKALVYLTNRRDGTPAQSVTVTRDQEPLEYGNIPTPENSRAVGKPN